MAVSRAGEVYSPDPNILERKAADLLARQLGVTQARDRPAAPLAETIGAVQRRAVALAVVAGIVSGGLIGGIEVFVRQNLLGGMEDQLSQWEQLPYWVGFLVFAGIVSAVEILALYAIALRSAAALHHLAGPPPDKHYADLIMRGLARAALEFPNPRVQVFGIDPYAYMPRWRILANNALYRLKVGLSSFLMRLFFRRVAGRLIVRGLIPLLSGPLYAIWNAIITWRILRELRLRTFGPMAVHRITEQVAERREEFGGRTSELMMNGVGELLMRACDAHPNYVLLLSRLKEMFAADRNSLNVDWSRNQGALGRVNENDRRAVLAVLTLAAVLGTKVTRGQKKLLAAACADAGMRFDRGRLQILRNKLLGGELAAFDLGQLLDR